MILERLAIAGVTWLARTALSLRRTAPTEERRIPGEPVETQDVVAPDRDLLMSLGDEAGFEGGLQ